MLVAVAEGGCDGGDAAGGEDGEVRGREGREGVKGARGGCVVVDGGRLLLDDCVRVSFPLVLF